MSSLLHGIPTADSHYAITQAAAHKFEIRDSQILTTVENFGDVFLRHRRVVLFKQVVLGIKNQVDPSHDSFHTLVLKICVRSNAAVCDAINK